MIFAIVSAWLAYKKARDTNRSPILWALIAAAIFIGTQLLVQFGFGILIGLGIRFRGWSATLFDTYSIPIAIFAVIVSFGGTWLVLRYLDNLPEEKIFAAPPPPPDFSGRN